MKIIVQNLAIEYQDEGAGKTALFLHGWQDNLRTFDLLASSLSPKNRIVRLDLPGFGQSEAPKKAWDLDDYVRLVRNFIQKLNLRVDALVGHSFGGRIAIKGAAEGELQPRKIILVGSAGITKNRTLRHLLLRLLAKTGGWATHLPPLLIWREKLRAKIYGLIGSDYWKAGALKETFAKIVSEDLKANAKKITAPTLLIWGENDAETPLSDGRRFSRLIPDSKLEVISGAGHFVHREKYREVAKLIQEFL